MTSKNLPRINKVYRIFILGPYKHKCPAGFTDFNCIDVPRSWALIAFTSDNIESYK